MSKITYANKSTGDTVSAVEFNQIKTVVNDLDNTLGNTETLDLSDRPTFAQVQQMINDAIAGGGQPVQAPAVISNTDTAAWFKADDQTTITKDGSNNVSEWRDALSRSESLATQSAGQEPIWSSAGIAFTTGISKLYALMPIPQPITIYMVVKQFGSFTDGNRLFYGQDNVTSYGIVINGDPIVYLQAPNEFATRINYYGEFNVVKFVLNSSNSKILVNNFSEQVGNAGTNAMVDFIIGTLYEGVAANTQYKEIIIRKVADNSTDETEILNYLKSKYSIS